VLLGRIEEDREMVLSQGGLYEVRRGRPFLGLNETYPKRRRLSVRRDKGHSPEC
jgi:hypothetical protein